MPSRLTVKFDNEGLRFFNRVDKEFSLLTAKYIVTQRMKRSGELAVRYSRLLAGVRLRVRSGRLKSRIDYRIRVTRAYSTIELGVFKSVATRYAGIQDQGTVGRGGEYPDIVPKKAKALSIPVNSALKANGSAKYLGARRDRVHLTAIYFRRPKNANVIGALYSTKELREFRIQKKPGLPKPRWILVKKTKLKPRRFLTDAVDRVFRRLGPTIQSALVVFLMEGADRARALR